MITRHAKHVVLFEATSPKLAIAWYPLGHRMVKRTHTQVLVASDWFNNPIKRSIWWMSYLNRYVLSTDTDSLPVCLFLSPFLSLPSCLCVCQGRALPIESSCLSSQSRLLGCWISGIGLTFVSASILPSMNTWKWVEEIENTSRQTLPGCPWKWS